MNRCVHCGRPNRPGAAFCQDCGKPLGGQPAAPAAPTPRVRPPTPVAGVPIGETCQTCRTVNPPGMQFCKMCGTPLASRAPGPAVPAQAPVVPPAAPPLVPVNYTPPPPANAASTQTFTCAVCASPTPAGFTFCQNCGARLEAPTQVSPPPLARPQVLSTLPGTPPGTPSGQHTPPAGTPPLPQAAAKRGDPMAVTFRADLPVSVLTASGGWGVLVRVHVDGKDGTRTPLTEREVTLGRDPGGLSFADDRYLAGRHATIERGPQGATLRVLDEVNGVFVRLREAHLLVDGDAVLVGQQVLRYEQVVAPEREPAPLTQHGVSLFGTPARAAWGRLRQLTTAGLTRDVIHLGRPEVVLGREDGDHHFPDDDFMSRRHVAFTHAGGRAQVSDLGSSNGTYVRVRGEAQLRPGDVFRLGDQLLRFEQG